MNLLKQWLQKWVCEPTRPQTGYEEICRIKDRLYQDISRLEQLQGNITASVNVDAIVTEVLGPKLRRNSQ